MWVPSLGWEDPLEKEMATHSSILGWKISWTGVWRATVHGVTREGYDLATKAPPRAWEKFPYILICIFSENERVCPTLTCLCPKIYS